MSLSEARLTLMAVLMAALLSGEHKAQLKELSCLDFINLSVISYEALCFHPKTFPVGSIDVVVSLPSGFGAPGNSVVDSA